MSTTISAAFIKQWSDEVKHDFQQKRSKLREAVRVVSGVKASTYDFHKLDAQASANTKAQGALITPLDPTHSTVTATLVDAYAGNYIDKLDQLKTNPDMKREYIETFSRLMGREVDDRIFASLATTANTVGTGTTLTYANINLAREFMDDNDVDEEDRIAVVTPKALTTILAEEKLTSADYMNLKAVVNGDVDTALGFKWIKSTRNTGKGTIAASQYFFQKSAVGLVIGQDITTEMEYYVNRASTFVSCMLSMGAALIEPAGVCKVVTDES